MESVDSAIFALASLSYPVLSGANTYPYLVNEDLNRWYDYLDY